MLKVRNHVFARSVAASLFLSVVACGQVDDTQEVSTTKVTNGQQASNEFPSVVLLHFSTGSFGSSICTGTFVNDAQVVTAAHCVYDLVKAGRSASSMSFTANGSSQRIAATSMKYHPDYTVVQGRLSNHDLAVVTFPRNSAPATTKLYPRTPYVGQKFTIVGFGVNDYQYDAAGQQTGSGSGMKRKGENQIDQIDNGMIRFSGIATARDAETALGKESASGSGDSGGPMLIEGAIAAVTAGGGLSQTVDADGNRELVKVSNYVDLNEASNSDFLEANLL